MPRIDLDYAPTLTPELVCELERAARWIGLPLRELELLGQDPDQAQGFVTSVDRGEHEAFLDAAPWVALEALLHGRESLTLHGPSSRREATVAS